MKKKKGLKKGIIGKPQTRKEKQAAKIKAQENVLKVVKGGKEPEKKDGAFIPKIIICPSYKSLELVKTEFIAYLGARSMGLCLITLKEAIEHKLPIRKAQQDYSNKIPNDIYLANTVDELVPEEYQDQKEIINLDAVVSHFRKNTRKQERNNPCLCESGKKFKDCCLNVN